MELKKSLQHLLFASALFALLLSPAAQAHALLIDADQAVLGKSHSGKKSDLVFADKGKHKGHDKDESDEDKDHGVGNDDKEEKSKKDKKDKKGKKGGKKK